MSAVNLILIVGGIILIGVGWSRARGPWARYRALQDEDANIARYEAWRGGLRDEGKTGASVAMEILKHQARLGALVAAFGGALVVAGLLVR
jgi:hypothetical protein